ncbi:Hypothetical predicted protein [Paramuricea clavata]|uniref:Uncharacterized protein n=1 Tax=Paramuricea clavata TaxID=317549 RepID=A0A6S7G1A9_PARCT|nr:Hypothetical predicted protein [Paramuricea clavata]
MTKLLIESILGQPNTFLQHVVILGCIRSFGFADEVLERKQPLNLCDKETTVYNNVYKPIKYILGPNQKHFSNMLSFFDVLVHLDLQMKYLKENSH